MKVIPPLLFSLLFCLAPSLQATPLSGQELNRYMQHVGGQDYQGGLYEGFVMGVSDGLAGTSLYYYCPPVNVRKERLLGAVSSYLKSHANDLHVPAGALVTAALVEAFPCRKKIPEKD
jgi:hypothetical protein